MSSNKIISSKAIGNVTLGGKKVALAIATHTQNWKRPENVALAQAPGFKKAVEKSSTPLPSATAKITQRESQHPSPADTKDHYTGVLEDANNKYLESRHFYKQG
ncbi:hypothetical protein N7G274_005177 [Stereocaulon virgatum]|uniref:Uncharacterized protein n=1 Tax=Stereocaulon virgatum TaxID=373712 RepID=A0ABR4AB99_9LECA